MSWTDPKMKTALLGGSTSGGRRQHKLDAVLASSSIAAR
jgi:hypothetical protein